MFANEYIKAKELKRSRNSALKKMSAEEADVEYEESFATDVFIRL